MHPRIPNTIPRIPKMLTETELLIDSVVVVAEVGAGVTVSVPPVPVGVGLVALVGDGVVPVEGVLPVVGVPAEAVVGELVDVDGVLGVPDPVAAVGLGVLWDGVGAPAGPELEPPVAPAAPIRYPLEHCTEEP